MDTAPARALLADVRTRRRRSAGVRGLAWTVAALCSAIVVSFVLDWLLDLPVAVRVVHLAFVAAAIAGVAWITFVRPLRAQEADEDTAASVEREVPEFQDRLVSALDFETRMRDAAEPESREMMARTIADASAIAGRIDAALLVDGRPARRAGLAALGALACLVGTEIAAGEQFGIWLRRGVLLEDITWPRRTIIRVLDFMEDVPRIVTKGDDLRIVAEVTGDRPQDLDLHFEEIDDATGDVIVRDLRRLYPVQDQAGRYAFDFRAVPTSFRFWVTGGDDLDTRPLYVVRALTRPGIASHVARVEYPSYSGIPAVEIREPAVQALVGTKVTYSFVANLPLQSARLVLGGAAVTAAAGDPDAPPAQGAPGAGAALGVELALAEDRRSFRWEVTLTETTDVHLVLTAVEGHTNRPDDDNYRLEVVNDRPPVIRVLYPYDRLTRTHVGLLPVKTVVEDDFGLRDVRLDYHEGTNPSSTMRIWPAEPEGPGPAPGTVPAADSGTAPKKSVHLHRPLDLDKLPKESGIDLQPGDVFTVQVHAADTGGGESTSRDLVVEIATREDVHNRLTGEMHRLREDVTQARRVQRRTLAALRELQAKLAAAPGGAADAAALMRAKDLAIDVSRAVADVQRFESGIFRVFDSYAMNRIGSEQTIDRLIPMYVEALNAPPDETGAIFPQKLYDLIVDQKRAKIIYDKDVLGILLDVMDLTNVVRLARGPAAYDTLDRWSGAEAPKVSTAAELEAPIAAGEALLAAFDAIEDRMQRFQDLAEIVATLQRLRDEEDRLARIPDTTGK